jgi:hypothetical protein
VRQELKLEVFENNVLKITFGSKIQEAGNLKYYQDEGRTTLRWILGKQVVRLVVDETCSALCTRS